MQQVKQTTAMMQLLMMIEQKLTLKKNSNNEFTIGKHLAYLLVKEQIVKLLEVEKQHIVDAFDAGQKDVIKVVQEFVPFLNDDTPPKGKEDAMEYFNNKYLT